MSCVIQIIESRIGEPTEHDGRYLVEYVPASQDARGHYGPDGVLRTTEKLGEAKRFKNAGEAFDCWQLAKGLRPDGLPNRPLTAWTVNIFDPECV